MIRRLRMPALLGIGVLTAVLTPAARSRAEEQRRAPPNLTVRFMPPLAGIQFPAFGGPVGGGLMNLFGASGSLRLVDLAELEFGYQAGLFAFCDGSRRSTGRAGVAPRVWGASIWTLRIPVLAGGSYTVFKGGCVEEPNGHAVAATVASGPDLSISFFDIRILANAGWQWVSNQSYFGEVGHPDTFTWGASLELGATFDLGHRTDRRSE